MKHIFIFIAALYGWTLPLAAQTAFGEGKLKVETVAANAVRVQYAEEFPLHSDLPDWLYVKQRGTKATEPTRNFADAVKVNVDARHGRIEIADKKGNVVFTATRHELLQGRATLAFSAAKDECLYGLGQFQDGYSNVRGLSRRLTQVNTQIALPMLISSKGYGILWNNYGLTEFNPCSESVRLEKLNGEGTREVVNVTSTDGGKKEVRERHVFEAAVDIAESGDYALLLDVGQKMARRHNLSIDGQTVIEMQNLWLPPTASKIVRLDKGRHTLRAELTKDDKPVVHYGKVTDETVFQSPVATAVDYTVFIGTPDEIIAAYRQLTGECPPMPRWALGYIHCRERFHSSEEILETARRFRQEQMPVSMMVQDWQYWGRHGWNAMRFDEERYPDPKALTDSLHQMDIRLMLSVWSKIDRNSEVGRQMERDNYYIPGTDWIDFFNPRAAASYWENFRERLLPLGIDAWWQDATEPENDDLAGRRVNNGRWSGEQVRNVYPLLVNKTVYEGLVAAGREPMILTRCGFPGIQRYGSALWSGDVGNDWETLRRQIVAGLGVQAAGVPWWTYDAGGFFRPADQYTNQDYIERMLRWIETSVYLPLMRVHGYMSNTEPWNYGEEARQIISGCLKERERLRPYIERCAERVSKEGYTLMRPLVFDFADDPMALQQKYEYMFGPSLLVSPVTEPGVTQWSTYLPKNGGGWTDYRTGRHYDGGQTVTTAVGKSFIPVFVRAGFEKYLPSAPILPYQNPALSARERAEDLCSRLTLEEKAQLMLDESPAIERLGIKKFFWWSEALHGAANMGGVTNFPEPVGMAASFNPELLHKCFDIASTEMRAQYNHRLYDLGGEDMKMRSLSVWTPNVNIFRDPRWGRGQETYGEDPYLTSMMGDAVVRGLQGDPLRGKTGQHKYRKLLACAKHFAVHSGPEYTRHTANLTDVPVRDLWETYMPAFKHLVTKSDVREVMCAYQRIDDDPCCGSNRLLQQILRQEWGFKYLVVSDCGAISDFYSSHKSSSGPVTASAKAALAGTDVECGYGYAYKSIPEAVSRGLISEAEVDKHVVRLLEGRFDLGEMDAPELVEWSRIPYSAMSAKASAQTALDMARQTIVLLQNKDNTLPLNKRERVAVIGPNANNEPMMWGNYNGTPNRTITILDGIRAKARKVLYDTGCDLTNDKVMECRIATECTSPDGKRGIRGTFWTNTEMEGSAFTTEYYAKPVNVTTAGMHVFAASLPVEDFSAKYETTFQPREAGEYVLNVEGTGHFEVFVNGELRERHHIWRATPTRTVLAAEPGQKFQIEVRFKTVRTWGASMKIDVARELPIDYQETIARLKGIDTVIFVGGIAPSLEGEEMPVNIEGFKGGDRTSIELPKVQRQFLRELKAAGKKVVFVCCSGSAIALEPETASCDAIIQAWYPGQEGGTAVSDVIFGDYNPCGKLPVTFYRNDSQLPPYEDYSMRGRTYRYFDDALFPFGYGLSYTTFEVRNATVQKSGDGSVCVTVDVANTGERDGTETLQLYIRNPQDANGPLKTLRAFRRVEVKAGKARKAELKLAPESFMLWDTDTNTMRVKPGKHEIFVGNSSDNKDLKKLEIIL